jgi:hypothetical protein
MHRTQESEVAGNCTHDRPTPGCNDACHGEMSRARLCAWCVLLACVVLVCVMLASLVLVMLVALVLAQGSQQGDGALRGASAWSTAMRARHVTDTLLIHM